HGEGAAGIEQVRRPLRGARARTSSAQRTVLPLRDRAPAEHALRADAGPGASRPGAAAAHRAPARGRGPRRPPPRTARRRAAHPGPTSVPGGAPPDPRDDRAGVLPVLARPAPVGLPGDDVAASSRTARRPL